MDTLDNVNQTPKPFGTTLTEPLYAAILDALENNTGRLNLLLSLLHPSDVADLIERLPLEQRMPVVQRIKQDELGDVITNLSSGVQEWVLDELGSDSVNTLLKDMDSDDVADIVQQLDDDQAAYAIKRIPKEQRSLLNYPEESAGGIMQLEVVTAPPSWTIQKLMDHLRSNAANLPDRLTMVYITDTNRKLLGAMSLSRLVRLDPKKKLQDTMRIDPLSVTPDTPQDDVARLFEKYDVMSCAVVNGNKQIIGIITIDDVLDVVIEEHNYEILSSAGLSEGEDLFAPAVRTASRRLPWLMVNLVTAVAAASVIALFQESIQKLVALAVLMPIVASLGGNSGSQTLTVAIRGLAMKQITPQNALILLKKELRVGGFNGLVLGILLAIGTALIYGDIKLGAVIFTAAMANHFFAALAGNMIPVILDRLKIDPTLASGILVTTVTDVMGFFTFLGLATLFLI